MCYLEPGAVLCGSTAPNLLRLAEQGDQRKDYANDGRDSANFLTINIISQEEREHRIPDLGKTITQTHVPVNRFTKICISYTKNSHDGVIWHVDGKILIKNLCLLLQYIINGV